MKWFIPLVVLLVVLGGCGTKLIPIHATHEVDQNGDLNKADVAKVGESLLSGLDMYIYSAYSPRQAVNVPAPGKSSLVTLSPDQQWIAYYRLCDGSLVIEAPASVTSEELRLGLRIDEDGRIQGKRPWFDLKRRTRISQSSWEGQRHLLFMKNGTYAVDTFIFDIRYAGMREEQGVFEIVDYKASGFGKPKSEKRIMAPETLFKLHGLDIRIVAIYPDHVRYVVEPSRQ